MRRIALVLVIACAVAGCKREPGFDERYEAASRKIVDRAKAIDDQVVASGIPSAPGFDGDVPDTDER